MAPCQRLRIISRKRRHRVAFIPSSLLWILLFSQSPTPIHARSPSKNPFTLPTVPKQQSQQQQHVLIYETEVLETDDSASIWKGAAPGRWTTQSGDESPSPINVQAPSHSSWQGDWKIVMSPTTDELGWQYIGTTRRRRTWLRSIRIQEQKQTSTSVSTSTVTKRPLLFPLFTLLDFIREDWNFKGFGVSLYKSLLFLESFGFAFRIPISQNLDWCERHPLFPSISSSVGVYYPPTVALFFNVGANVDYLKWSCRRILQKIKISSRKLCVRLLRILLLIASLPFLMLNQKVNRADGKIQQWLSSIPTSPDQNQQQQIQSPLNVDISERVGMSVSWRLSRKRGYEFRVSYWHSYLPTIMYLHSLLSFLEKSKSLPMEYWWRRTSGSLGISTSGPTPSPPHMSCSACLSLSGFHYSSLPRWKLEKDSSRIILQSGKEQLQSKIKSTAASSGNAEQVLKQAREDEEIEVKEAGGVKVAR